MKLFRTMPYAGSIWVKTSECSPRVSQLESFKKYKESSLLVFNAIADTLEVRNTSEYKGIKLDAKVKGAVAHPSNTMRKNL